MGAAYRRFRSGVRVSWSSSIAFATLGTALVTLIVLPLLDIAFAILMGSDVAAPDLARTGYAAALVAWSLSIASGIVAAIAADRTLGIYLVVHQYRRIDVAYWLSRATMPTLLSLVTGATSIGAVALFSSDTAMLLRVCALVPVVVIVGIAMGIGAAGIGVSLPDPYLGATILGSFVPVFSGVIVPVDLCPAWVRVIATVVPGSGLASSVAEFSAPGLLRDLACALVYAGIGIAFTQRAARALRSGRRFDTL
ncbi:ABC transporter [Nanchangia anserum]|uniref:ABC transporter n=1 Tax=Nanchangia anserum TaxID=2692125 RepID=A0A8I0GFE6_9ACTO|nr:ABC transporter [Nanchangia anserum]MBD3689029.1 ABC transporter [Nanchangia anserum]QOX81272.1 ABC transporter [Nanchangia anserum]